jgi:hypothetical protein
MIPSSSAAPFHSLVDKFRNVASHDQRPVGRSASSNAPMSAGAAASSIPESNGGNGGSSAAINSDTPEIRTQNSISSNMTTLGQTSIETALYVFLAVQTGDESRLAQIKAQNLHDDAFFETLRDEYKILRGFARRIFSIWKYSHCEFSRVSRIILDVTVCSDHLV